MVEDNNNYILLYHRGGDMDISKFMERNHIYGIEPKDLFEINKDFIFEQMSDSDKKKEKEKFGKYPESGSDLKLESILPAPCVLKTNPNKITAELSISQTNAQINTDDFYAFADEKIQDILQNEGFRADTSSKKPVDCQVFGWFKSLYWIGKNTGGGTNWLNKKTSQFSDLSKYIISLATTVTNNGGSFVIKLPIISARNLGITQITSEVNNKDFGFLPKSVKGGTAYRFGDNYYSKSEFDDIESNYFNWLISSNDLIFISFEKLEIEKKRNEWALGDEDSFSLESVISSGVYDMIGLVDDVKVVTNSQSSEAHVEITGRDLMKLLIEDGTFFFNPSTTSDPSTVFGNVQSAGKQGDIKEADFMNNSFNNPVNRLRRVTGEIDIFSNRINMDIGYILKGVISQLANVEVVPGYVFDSWGNDRTKFIELKPKEK